MAEKSYHILEVVGTSKISMEDAVHGAIASVANKDKKLNWFEVIETRGFIDGDKVAYFQVTIKIGYEIT